MPYSSAAPTVTTSVPAGGPFELLRTANDPRSTADRSADEDQALRVRVGPGRPVAGRRGEPRTGHDGAFDTAVLRSRVTGAVARYRGARPPVGTAYARDPAVDGHWRGGLGAPLGGARCRTRRGDGDRRAMRQRARVSRGARRLSLAAVGLVRLGLAIGPSAGPRYTVGTAMVSRVDARRPPRMTTAIGPTTRGRPDRIRARGTGRTATAVPSSRHDGPPAPAADQLDALRPLPPTSAGRKCSDRACSPHRRRREEADQRTERELPIADSQPGDDPADDRRRPSSRASIAARPPTPERRLKHEEHPEPIAASPPRGRSPTPRPARSGTAAPPGLSAWYSSGKAIPPRADCARQRARLPISRPATVAPTSINRMTPSQPDDGRASGRCRTSATSESRTWPPSGVSMSRSPTLESALAKLRCQPPRRPRRPSGPRRGSRPRCPRAGSSRRAGSRPASSRGWRPR